MRKQLFHVVSCDKYLAAFLRNITFVTLGTTFIRKDER